jgi:hypothetical protein
VDKKISGKINENLNWKKYYVTIIMRYKSSTYTRRRVVEDNTETFRISTREVCRTIIYKYWLAINRRRSPMSAQRYQLVRGCIRGRLNGSFTCSPQRGGFTTNEITMLPWWTYYVHFYRDRIWTYRRATAERSKNKMRFHHENRVCFEWASCVYEQ